MSWYLLKDRRHEGPYSRDDLLNQVLQGELKLESYLIRAEDLERGVISYVRVSGVVGALLPPEGVGPTGEARRETRDPDNIDAFVPQAPGDSLPPERIAALAPSLDVQPADLVGRGARTQEIRTQETRLSEVSVSDEPSWLENLFTVKTLGRVAGAFAFLWILSLGVDQWNAPRAGRQVAAVRGEKPASRRSPRVARPARPSDGGMQSRPRLMPTERPVNDPSVSVNSAMETSSPAPAPMDANGRRMRNLTAPVPSENGQNPEEQATTAEDPVIGEGGAEPVNGDDREPGQIEAEPGEEAEAVEEPTFEDNPDVEIVPEENQ